MAARVVADDVASKTCPRCGQTKPPGAFYFKRTENRRHSWCRPCLFHFHMLRWKDRKRKAVELLGGECIRCGYRRNMAAFHFHHTDPNQKEFDWNRLRLRSWDSVVSELKKCVLLCANCHAEVHAPGEDLADYSGSDNRSLNNPGPLPTGVCGCGTPVYGTRFCSPACASLARRKVRRPGKPQLAALLATNTRSALARQYGVSETAIRKWVAAYGLR